MSKPKSSLPAVQVIAAPADLEEDNPQDNPWLVLPAKPTGTPGADVMDNITTHSPSKRRQMSPASLANLKPFEPGHKHGPGNPYPISRHLKDLIAEINPDGKLKGRVVAEKLYETACSPGSRGYPVAVSAVLDRTEGKVTGDEAKAPTVNILNVIVKDAETKADLTLLKAMGKTAKLPEQLTEGLVNG